MKKRKSAVIGTFSGKCCDSTVVNNNDMFLNGELFDNLFASDEFKRALENRHYIGFLGHPQDPGCMDYEHACIVMTECHKEQNGEISGTFDLIDTPVGRIVKAFIDAGVKFGISIRGAGDVAGDGTVDPETFVFRGFDLVTFPAYDDAIPTFQEIAASTDLTKQAKYKQVCSAVTSSLKDITSSTTLETIQAQFNEQSDEYKAIEARMEELSDSEDDEDDDDVDNESVLADKVQGMTQLYLDQVAANSDLRKQLSELHMSSSKAEVEYLRKVDSIKRIMCSQVKGLEKELEEVTGSYNVSIAANTRLKKQNEQLKKNNLKYTHKIEANSKTICERDSTISDLEAKLRKTVTASSKVEGRASNLDEEVKSLRARVEAAEQMVLNYQQAYANMYANALGVCLENLPVTASTSVSELKDMISSGTNTSGMAASPFVDTDPYDITEIEDEENSEDDMVTL